MSLALMYCENAVSAFLIAFCRSVSTLGFGSFLTVVLSNPVLLSGVRLRGLLTAIGFFGFCGQKDW